MKRRGEAPQSLAEGDDDHFRFVLQDPILCVIGHCFETLSFVTVKVSPHQGLSAHTPRLSGERMQRYGRHGKGWSGVDQGVVSLCLHHANWKVN